MGHTGPVKMPLFELLWFLKGPAVELIYLPESIFLPHPYLDFIRTLNYLVKEHIFLNEE